MANSQSNPQGLSSAEARARQAKYGKNLLTVEKKERFWRKALHVACEPMFLLLLAAALIYFLLGDPGDGGVMVMFVGVMIGIDLAQQWKTGRTLQALQDLSAPRVAVWRGGALQDIASADLVPGDLMQLHEGVKVPADGVILQCSDLRADESSLTGESEEVWKEPFDGAPKGSPWRTDYCYAGTLITQGSALVEVERIGTATEYGKIGLDVAVADDRPTPLQKQTARLVRTCALIAVGLFALVAAATFLNLDGWPVADRLIQSVLSGITLAMAMIPEEFPVILTVFLSMGAWRLAKQNALIRRLPSVETLGAVSVLCVDKTGTITQNKMAVQALWSPDGDENELIRIMGLGCEQETYDPMEQAMLACCENNGLDRAALFSGELLFEYPFTHEDKRMGHVWRLPSGERLLAAKGSPESMLDLCALTPEEGAPVRAELARLSGLGLRVIAVAKERLDPGTKIPRALGDCHPVFVGLIGLSDPPRPSVKEDIARCRAAGIRVKMITGDNGLTAAAIARSIGMDRPDQFLSGAQIDQMDYAELARQTADTDLFVRVAPTHKMRIVKALQAQGEIVAMTGDGVNDAPALKHADIGIAMGKRGSQVSREAADLILMDDRFATIVDTVRDGRRIYDNVRKAVDYVFAIHVPIAAASLLAPILGIGPGELFLLPIHVVLMELVIDPTCSIVLERLPAEEGLMDRPPRRPGEPLLLARRLLRSLLQGTVLFTASFGAYFYLLPRLGAESARSAGLAVLILANLFLVLSGGSDTESALRAFYRGTKEKILWFVVAGTLLGLGIILYSPLHSFLKLAPLPPLTLLAAGAMAAVSVYWYEIAKWIKRKKA